MPPAQTKPPRVRRGNLDDQATLRAQVVRVAFDIFRRQGMRALTMRAVAAEVGMSAMALYRYFDGKAELLRGLWDFVLVEIRDEIAAAEAAAATPQDRVMARMEAIVRYWETHPERYRLVYATPQALAGGTDGDWTATPVYQDLMDGSMRRMQELAESLGGDPGQARIACDMQHCLIQGYLYSRIVNRRYPWTDLPALRAGTLASAMDAIRRCLRGDCAAG